MRRSLKGLESSRSSSGIKPTTNTQTRSSNEVLKHKGEQCLSECEGDSQWLFATQLVSHAVVGAVGIAVHELRARSRYTQAG